MFRHEIVVRFQNLPERSRRLLVDRLFHQEIVPRGDARGLHAPGVTMVLSYVFS